MFVILLLIAPALCEWVEISQHHVRKPTRTHSFRPVPVTEEYFEDTTRTTKIYLNQTLTERSWSRGNVNKVPKLGNIQRVQVNDSPIKAPSLSVNPMTNSLFVGGAKTVNKHDIKESASGADSDLMDTKRHKISASNIEKVNRQVISNTKKIFQEITSEDVRSETSLSSKNNRPLNQLERANFNKHGPRNPNWEDVLNAFNIPRAEVRTNVSIRPDIFGYDKSNKKSAFTTALETTNIRRHDLAQVPPVFADEISVEKIISSDKDFTQRNKHIQHTNLNTKDEEPKSPSNVIPSKLTNHEFVTKINKPVDKMEATVSDDNEDIGNSSDPERQNSEQEENVEASNKVNSLENLMTFMKVVADTIRKNTRRSVNSKTRYLTNLKNSILANIAERIDAAWPDDEPKLPRTRRAAQATARGHLEIPSSESALMTISFLTFAVFLIKLVLQVIQTYKNKAMMVSPAVVAVGRAATKRSSKP
ncbi:hypothetical protein ABMA28_007461 [Loxostege sticticalis]|uniref:Uncharacterized protein n=1 Tax=Loxostege sticticalis TaxID=481309 RepID=A0ABD0SJV9_LOXSC